MFWSPIIEAEVMNIVTLMNRGNSEALDDSFSNLVKAVIPGITIVFTHIINLILHAGVFLTSFKVSKVIALHKGDDRNNPSNYRPISILSVLTKIVERAL